MGKILSTHHARSTSVRAWEVATGRQVLEVHGYEAVAFTQDGKYLLAPGTNHSINMYDTTGIKTRAFKGHSNWVGRPCVSPDDKRILTGSHDGTLRLWDLAAGNESAKKETGCETQGIFSPDGNYFLTWDKTPNRRIQLWKTATVTVVRSWNHPTAELWCWSTFLPDGRQFLTLGSNGVVRWWDVNEDKEVKSLRLAVGEINAAGISRDGRRLIYCSIPDRVVHLVDLPSGTEVMQFGAPAVVYGWMAFSPDGRYAAGASCWGWIYLWRLPDAPGAKNRP
jgi:WD40 repeat protein